MVMIGFAVGAIVVGALLARVRVRAKARASMLAWALYLPAYGLIALTSSLPLLVVAAVGTGAGETISYVLLNSAAQEEVPDAVLGRVLGVISFVHRGAHATGLLLVAPLFAVAAARPLFGAAACVTAAIGLVGAALAVRVARGVPNSI
jgi:MFS family permease